MGIILAIDELISIRKAIKNNNQKLVFTNGCFDIIHKGHIDYLNEAKKLGDYLVVGVNSDTSVRTLKGPKRPILTQDERAFIISNLIAVDFVCIFDEETPLKLIENVIPDFLVKGADWLIDAVVGKEVVEKNDGKVVTIKLTPNKSTTNLIETILKTYNN
jgi:D-beta-D-heptose 7-phosphate kinase/D-beta-D-heptose 1-phosphate adenosyltransferase